MEREPVRYMNLFLLLCLFILTPAASLAQVPAVENLSPPTAQQSQANHKKPGDETVGSVDDKDFPGVGEVLPRLTQLREEADTALNRITGLDQTDSLKTAIQKIGGRLDQLRKKRQGLGTIESLSVYRLQDLSTQLEELRHQQENRLTSLSEKIGKLEEVRQAWEKKRSFWKDWQGSLQRRSAEIPEGAFSEAENFVAKVLARSDQGINPLVRYQKNLIALKEETRSLLNEVQRTVTQDTFKKTSPTFFESKFLGQFNAELWQLVKRGIEEVDAVNKSFLQEQGWFIGLQALTVLVIGGFIRRYRRQAETAEEWDFLLRHPWGTGIFTAFTVIGIFYSYAPALWTFLQWVMAAASGAVLLTALLQNRSKIAVVWLLAGLFTLSLALQLIALPQPLYRLYLAFVALIGIPLLIRFARKIQKETETFSGFVFGLYLGALVLLVALMAQIAGFNILAFRLFESSLKTVFLFLIATMFIRLGQGAIDFLFDQEFLRKWRFFRRYGQELSQKLKQLFQVFVVLNALIYLLQVWDLYDTVFEAWGDLLDLGFSLGELQITLKMALVILLVVYVSIVASWFIRAFLEAEIFPRQHIDRGLRDSIKRLLHYTLVLVGFLMALTLAGVELKNFAVLAGAFGIGIGFGLQNIVNNFVSGLILLFERPIKVGDMVIVDEEWGTVRNIGLRSTVVTTLDESEIIVPNSMLISEKVTNWSLSSPQARIVVPVGVAYGSDVPLVMKILDEVAEKISDILDDPPPSSLFKGFGDSSLDFEVRAWIADVRDRLRVKSEICQYIDSRFREENVTIPFPQRDLHLQSVADEFAEKMSGGNKPDHQKVQEKKAGSKEKGSFNGSKRTVPDNSKRQERSPPAEKQKTGKRDASKNGGADGD